ncbi:MAG TPA: hypothetical protein VFE17_10445 [Candidatus Baltobacteraceae bacterium]|jgi:hypothetical protein|nr:hypothetical protein [Candidatus Baltobacteraceae bacterium]
MTSARYIVPAIAAIAIAGCGGSNAAYQPTVSAVSPVGSNKLQFAVGIATIASNGGGTITYGLNTVETLRQKNGLSGSLFNVPIITLPTTMTVPGNPLYIDNDAGTNRITQNTLNEPNIGLPTNGTGVPLANPTAGAFGYGFCECNSNSGPINGFAPLFIAYALPLIGQPGLQYFGGPPAFAPISPDLAAQNFSGYSIGFTDIAMPAALGSYRLDVAFPPSYGTSVNSDTPTLSATTQLVSTQPLAAFATPAFTADGNGGGTIGIAVPAGATEALVFVKVLTAAPSQDPCTAAHSTTQYFTVNVAPNSTTATLPDSLGQPMSDGKAARTICSGESYEVYAAAFDYPAFEASYPANLQQTPVISAASGQADVSTSDVAGGQYP